MCERCFNNNILLAKLQAYGIRGDYIKWFRSYLTDHTQYVNFNGEESAEHTLKCGVPQGAILGPLYFLLSLSMTCLMFPVSCLKCCMQTTLIYIYIYIYIYKIR